MLHELQSLARDKSVQALSAYTMPSMGTFLCLLNVHSTNVRVARPLVAILNQTIDTSNGTIEFAHKKSWTRRRP